MTAPIMALIICPGIPATGTKRDRRNPASSRRREADKAKALDMFNKGEGGFKDRDLQPFCFNVSDGNLLHQPFRARLARISER